MSGLSARLLRAGLISIGVTVSAVPVSALVLAQGKELSERGKAADKNKNGVIDRNEAGGPLKANFDEMDCDKSGTLDGGEIRGFFTGEECPKQAAAAPAPAPAKKAIRLQRPRRPATASGCKTLGRRTLIDVNASLGQSRSNFPAARTAGLGISYPDDQNTVVHSRQSSAL